MKCNHCGQEIPNKDAYKATIQPALVTDPIVEETTEAVNENTGYAVLQTIIIIAAIILAIMGFSAMFV